MKRFFIFFFLFQTITFIAQNNISIGFIENKGQIIDQNQKENKEVKYLLNTPGLNVQIRKKGFSYDIYETKKVPLTKKDKEFYGINRDSNTESNNFPEHSLKYNFHRIDVDFVNANQDTKIIAEEKSTDYDNYYNVIHVPEGITNVHKYQKITYQNIYNNIDIAFFIPKDSTKVVEYNFIVRPGGKISDIKLKFKGAKTNLIDNKIRMKVKFGEMEEIIPLSWIENENEKEEIKISYKEVSKNTYSFYSNTDITNRTIVIDPTPIRLWGTYYGGEKDEYLLSLENDLQGNSYICGSTSSKDYIASSGSHQGTFGSINYYSPNLYITDGFISKFDEDGNKLWSTFYGGEHNDFIKDISISSNGLIAFCGNTWSSNNISTINSFKNFKSGSYEEMFFGILNSNGIRNWATYFGDNSGRSWANAVSFDQNNNLFIAGTTSCINYIATSNSFKSTPPTSSYDFDGFITLFNISGNQIWGTYYGGDFGDFIEDLIIDNNGNAIALGYTNSPNGISSINTYQSNLNNNINITPPKNDGFLTSFNLIGNRNWGTYFGTENDDKLFRLKCFNNFLYLIGETNNTNFATPNAFEYTNSSFFNSMSFIAKFDFINQQKIWASYSTPKITDLDISINEEIYLVGESNYLTSNIATPNAFLTTNGGFVSYIRKINNDCNIQWGTYLGLTGFVQNPFIKYNQNESTFIVSGTCSTYSGYDYGLSTINSQQEISNGNYETYLNKFFDCQSSSLATSNSPICINSTIQLTASGGTNYLWSGPNGFTSTEQNPTIPNATALYSGQYSCEITGSGGCDDTVTVNLVVGDNLAPIPDMQNLPNINGDCNTVISIFPTATDNCSGSITATTSDPLSYSTSGNHIITWIYDDGNGNTASQTQNIIISSVADPTMNSPQEFCIQENATLNDIAITGQNITWYDAQTNGNILPNSTVLVDGATYYATQTINGCESDRVLVSINILNTPAPTTTQNTQSFCSTENATLNSISINGSSILWYDSINSTIPFANSTLLTDGTTYYASQTLNNCESINRLAITIQLINTLNASNYSEIICDEQNNSIENVDLSIYESNLLNSTGNIYTYYNSLNGAENQLSSDLINNYSNYDLALGVNTFYIRIESPNTCYQIVELTLTLVEKPKANITNTMPICEGSSITISAENGYDSYLWSTGETTNSISVSQPGNYNVVINQNHSSVTCSSTYTFNVVNSNIAIINSIQSEDWTENENYIQINVSGNGDYEYSINGIDFQESNIFGNLPNGEYTIYVRDKNGCGIVSEDIYLLMYPKFFTPNGDGFNDTWKIKFSKKEPNMKIKIFDRYGKLLKQLSSLSEGWDGTYLGAPLPSNDYWFVVIRENGKEYKGHFSLKR